MVSYEGLRKVKQRRTYKDITQDIGQRESTTGRSLPPGQIAALRFGDLSSERETDIALGRNIPAMEAQNRQLALNEKLVGMQGQAYDDQKKAANTQAYADITALGVETFGKMGGYEWADRKLGLTNAPVETKALPGGTNATFGTEKSTLGYTRPSGADLWPETGGIAPVTESPGTVPAIVPGAQSPGASPVPASNLYAGPGAPTPGLELTSQTQALNQAGQTAGQAALTQPSVGLATQTGTTAVEGAAPVVAETAGSTVATETGKGAATTTAGSTAGSVVGGVIGVVGMGYSAYNIAKSSDKMTDTSRATSIASMAVSGAMAGSVVPIVGTIIGAVVGAVVGTVATYWDNLFG